MTETLNQNDFIEKADEGLMQQVKEGDYDGLVKVMEFLKVGCGFNNLLYNQMNCNLVFPKSMLNKF